MKVKEYFPSLLATLKLRRLSESSLLAAIKPEIPVIVSLTSIASRLRGLDITIRSVLSQSVAPQKIVLWLNHNLKNQIPDSLQTLTGGRFEIRFSERDSCHLKLVESLIAFNEKPIVTCDDDLIYAEDWLESLYRDHEKSPGAIIAHLCRSIIADEKYKNWPFERQRGVSANRLIALGYGGILYPPGIFESLAWEEGQYLAYAPRADDLWFKAMELKMGIPVQTCSRLVDEPKPIIGSQKVSLKKSNVNKDNNTPQWNALREQYGLDEYLVAE